MSCAHVYTVASGFGLRVVPISAPYSFALGATLGELNISRTIGTRTFEVRVVATAVGYTTTLSSGTEALDEVADVVPGPDWESWWLETSVYRIPLPEKWRAIGNDLHPSPFDLVGPNDELIFLQTPNSVPPLDRFAAPGQRLHRKGTGPRSRWVEVRYEHDGDLWAQRHDVVELDAVTCVVTLQCREALLAETISTGRLIVANVTGSEGRR